MYKRQEYDKEKLQERLAKLSGGVAVISVGAATETEMKERKYRIEDALNATRAAVEEGIVSGGGAALLSACKDLDALIATLDGDERTGAQIIRKAIEAPIRQIAANAGIDGSIVVDKLINEMCIRDRLIIGVMAATISTWPSGDISFAVSNIFLCSGLMHGASSSE